MSGYYKTWHRRVVTDDGSSDLFTIQFDFYIFLAQKYISQILKTHPLNYLSQILKRRKVCVPRTFLCSFFSGCGNVQSVTLVFGLSSDGHLSLRLVLAACVISGDHLEQYAGDQILISLSKGCLRSIQTN